VRKATTSKKGRTQRKRLGAQGYLRNQKIKGAQARTGRGEGAGGSSRLRKLLLRVTRSQGVRFMGGTLEGCNTFVFFPLYLEMTRRRSDCELGRV